MMRERLENVQALRGVAALMVLVAHVKGAEVEYGGSGTLLPHFLSMGVVGVDLFFLISGFVMAHVALSGPRGRRPAARFLFNRGARIYPVYWAATLLLLFLYAGKRVFFGEGTPFPNPVETFLLLPDDRYPLIPVGWTLVHEMYFYVVFALFVFFRGSRLFSFIAVWAAILAMALAMGDFGANAWTKVLFNPLTFEFMAGALIGAAVKIGVTEMAREVLITGVAIFAFQTVFAADLLYPDVMGQFGLRAAIVGPPLAMILYGAAALERREKALAPSWLIRTGDASYSLYLIHIPAFLVVGKLVTLVTPDGWFNNLALVVLLPAGALAAAFVLHSVVERPLLAVTKRWGDTLFARRKRPATAWRAAE